MTRVGFVMVCELCTQQKNKTTLNDFDFGIYEVAEKVVLSNAIKHGKSTKVQTKKGLAFEFGFEQK